MNEFFLYFSARKYISKNHVGGGFETLTLLSFDPHPVLGEKFG
jgi:hypothetical protein